MKLSSAEEQLMGFIWSLGNAFLKDLLEKYPEPKPALTTVSTLLKRMQEKGFVGYKVYGNSREYFPKVNKEEYFSNHINSVIKSYFSNSALQFASFFTANAKLSRKELEELRKIVDQEIKSKSK